MKSNFKFLFTMKPKFNIQAMKEYMGIAMFLFMAT